MDNGQVILNMKVCATDRTILFQPARQIQILYKSWIRHLEACGLRFMPVLEYIAHAPNLWEEDLFVVVLRNTNIISVIWLQWYDVRDEEEKAWAYTFTDSRDLYPQKPYRHGMRGTGLWWCHKLYTVGKWITSQLIIIAVTRGHTPVTMVTYRTL